jgi:hypothetical protein
MVSPLDNQSAVDVFVNPDLLRKIRETPCHLDVHCNVGTQVVDRQKALNPCENLKEPKRTLINGCYSDRLLEIIKPNGGSGRKDNTGKIR